MTIRSMTRADLDQVVALHMAAFPEFFLTFLGERFLRLLYMSLISDQEGIAWVASEGERIIGFAAGVRRQKGFYQRLIRRRLFGFALASAVAALKRPSVLPRLLRAFRRPQESGEASAEACLMSIATAPTVQNRGVGRQLVNHFCDSLRMEGTRSVCLTTDRDDNEKTNGFYKALGFQVSREFTTPEGRRMNEYFKEI